MQGAKFFRNEAYLAYAKGPFSKIPLGYCKEGEGVRGSASSAG